MNTISTIRDEGAKNKVQPFCYVNIEKEVREIQFLMLSN